MKLIENQIVGEEITNISLITKNIPNGVIFNNNGNTHAIYVKNINNVIFNNNGDISLDSVEEIKFTVFNNKGDIYLSDVEKIFGVQFNNIGVIYINKKLILNLPYKKLLNLYDKLPIDVSCDFKDFLLIKKDLLTILREKKLKIIINE